MAMARVILCLLFVLSPLSFASADLLGSRPSAEQVREATAQCRRGSAVPASGIVGISDPHTLDQAVVDLIAETGVRWVRAEFHWSQIQASPGAPYRWGPYDAMVERFNRAGINILAILTYVPPGMMHDWSVIDDEFQRFAEAAVQRYAPRGVHYWEVFNEPNLTGYGWLRKQDDPRSYLGAYTLLLARANQAVRENDPQGVVVLGGLASAAHRGLPAEETMDVIYGLDGGDCFDVFAYHPYGYQNRFPEARERVDAILAAHGDTGMPVWFNEYGWTDFEEMDMARNPHSGNNPMLAVFKQRDNADALFWFAAKDYSARRDAPTFGLADHNLNKRKSFDTFKAAIDHIQ